MDLAVIAAAVAAVAVGRGGEMEVEERRRRTALSQQLAAAAALDLAAPSSVSKIVSTSSSSLNLRDLLKVRQEEELLQQQQQARSRRSASISLGTFLACEKRELSTPGLAAAAIRSRTLLDIIQDEDGESRGTVYDGDVHSRHRISWRRAFKERLRIRRSGAPADGFSALPTPIIPVQENNPVSAGASPPTLSRPPAQTVASNSPNAAVSGGHQVEETRLGSSATTAESGEAAQQQQSQQVRVSLMALLDETDRQVGGPGFAVSALLEGVGGEEEEGAGEEEEEYGGKRDVVKCCVCMVRQKGAAFIPCGHTFCRLCSRELWVTRGSCPLCNGFILEILDIF